MLSAINAIYPAWRKAFCELYRITTEAGAGLVHWLGLWSAKPYMIPACDFNFMIGCEQFDRLCLPDIARQAQTVGRAVFHLDGPEAAKHAESLCRVPAIEAIQFSPGAQNLSALAWLDVFKMIQKRGRAVVIACPAHEALDVCRELDPSGLALLIDGSAQKLDKTVNEISHYFIG
jgi:hypothetical protein